MRSHGVRWSKIIIMNKHFCYFIMILKNSVRKRSPFSSFILGSYVVLVLLGVQRVVWEGELNLIRMCLYLWIIWQCWHNSEYKASKQGLYITTDKPSVQNVIWYRVVYWKWWRNTKHIKHEWDCTNYAGSTFQRSQYMHRIYLPFSSESRGRVSFVILRTIFSAFTFIHMLLRLTWYRRFF
jgi:hypothetical protein